MLHKSPHAQVYELESSFTAFPGYKQGTGQEVEQMGHGPVSKWDSGTGALACYATAPGPSLIT